MFSTTSHGWQRMMMIISSKKCRAWKYFKDFYFLADLKSLIYHLENSNYSTLIYVLSSESIDEPINVNGGNNRISHTSQHNDLMGYCDVIATEFSAIYKRNVVFWPCPGMRVSTNKQHMKRLIQFVILVKRSKFNFHPQSSFFFFLFILCLLKTPLMIT